jgi:DNA ligase (NAD+)
LDTLERIQDLVTRLNKASYEYYNTGHPIMDDAEFDRLLDKLQRLEAESGVVLKDSPTINAGSKVAKEQKKITHEHQMLSLDKIHSVDEIQKFLNKEWGIASIKLDGLTVSATYIKGKLTRLETRGNGDVGTDIMIHKNSIEGLPQKIKHSGKYVVDGECIITYDRFYDINATLGEDEKFSNPRNMASGSLNLLDSNVSAKRGLTFLVWNVIEDTELFRNSMKDNFDNASSLGFFVVPHTCLYHHDDATLNDALTQMKAQAGFYGYPMDGVVFSYMNIQYGKSLGKTGHHFNHSVAYKFEDELYETKLTDIEWNTSKTGLINPVAVFESVDLDGAITTRATLHNISYIENLQLGVGDTIQVYRANMVIPKVHNNLTKSNTWKLPIKCPNCGGDVEVHNENGSKTLHCINPDCKAKLLGRLTHFVSKNAANIENLSEQTLEKLIELGWLNSFKDIYKLSEHKDEMSKLDGFGKRSVEKLLDAIEKSRSITLDRFIYALCIPLIGRSASKDISKACANGDVQQFITIMSLEGEYAFIGLNGFGKEMCKSIVHWWVNNKDMFYELIKEFTFERVEEKSSGVDLNDKIFVITGSLNHYKNRDELVSVIEQLGGKVSGSVSAKTSYLINNDVTSTSGKNSKAKQLGIPIISEEDFMKMIGE